MSINYIFFPLALHLQGHFYEERYQNETDIKKLANILPGSCFKEGMQQTQKTYDRQTDKKSNTAVLEKIQKQNSFYLGNQLWAYFEVKKIETTRFISSAAA